MKIIDQETIWSKDGYRYTLSSYVDEDGMSVVVLEREVYNTRLGGYDNKETMWREERKMNLVA